ncbi:hypothetical protein Tco_0964938, partial [Tanacetum coccineum]
PYTPTIVTTLTVPVIEDSPAVPEQTTVETVMNMTPENRAHFESEKEAIHLILTGIGDEIYSTVDACQTAQEMWEAIERLQQGESLNIQDVKTNLFWEFGQFTSHDGETIESYYTRFYKMMNEMIRNNLTVATMQVNVQFLHTLTDGQICHNGEQQHNLELKFHTIASLTSETNQKGKFGHYAKECKKPKRVKDSTYHKEKMLLCKQAEKGVQLQAEQSDWLADTDEEIDEQELEAHYSYMAKIQEDDQNDVECDDERVALANLKLDVDENKKIQKQLKKEKQHAFKSLTENGKSILVETSRTLVESKNLKYFEYHEDELNELESDKAEFSHV